VVEPLLADASISISDFKKNPSAAIAAAEGFPIAILNRNRASAYLVPAKAWEELVDRLEDADLIALVCTRADETPVPISLDEL